MFPGLPYSSHTVFVDLVRAIGCDLICDVGCLDAFHSLDFAARFPGARIVGFEANPANFAKLQADVALRDSRVELHHAAVCDFEGETTFHSYQETTVARDGIGSLLKRTDCPVLTSYTVPAVRLDEFILGKRSDSRRIAVWIDVEGATSRVLAGMRGISSRVLIVHCEVETAAVYENQVGRESVRQLMEEMGYAEVAFAPHLARAGDAVFLRRPLLPWLFPRLVLSRMKSQVSAYLRSRRRDAKAAP